MLELKESATEKVSLFLLVVSSNHIDGATGLAPAVEISKNCGAFASPSTYLKCCLTSASSPAMKLRS